MRVKANRWWQTTHGMSDSPEYKVWNNMYSRCNNPNHPRYKDWGGRGIKMCEKWMSFEGFFEDMGRRPSDDSTIERIDNNKGYSKDNCRWATTKEQARNRRSNVLITYSEISETATDWAERLGVRRGTFLGRLSRGWTIEEAIEGKRWSTPRKRQATLRHMDGAHTRKCEIRTEKNTYKCKFTGDIFKKGVKYGRPYK